MTSHQTLSAFYLATSLTALAALLSSCQDVPALGHPDASPGRLKMVWISPTLMNEAAKTSEPAAEYAHVRIGLSSLDARKAGGGGWQRFPLENTEVDLVDLSTYYAVLSRVILSPGAYDSIRLITEESGTVELPDGRVFDLIVPSGTQTGIKINCSPAVEVGSEVLTVGVLAIDLGHSLKPVPGSSNSDPDYYHFKPVLHCSGTTPIPYPSSGDGEIPGDDDGSGDDGSGDDGSGDDGSGDDGTLPDDGSTGDDGGDDGSIGGGGSGGGGSGDGGFIDDDCDLSGSCYIPPIGV